MVAITVRGGVPLTGELEIRGAKNSVLPMLAASLLFRRGCMLRNCPQLSDVDAALEILRSLGCSVRRRNREILADSSGLSGTELPRALMRSMRASILFLGPLLARTGSCTLYAPGGCCLGARPIDLHLRGLTRMGIECSWEGDRLTCQGRLRGARIVLPFPSVGATENLILAALGATGETTLINAAREPEIGDLIAFLCKGGAGISGSGTSVLHIRGGLPEFANYAVMPDRVEAATYLAAALGTGGNVCLRNVRTENLNAVTDVLTRAGCRIETGGDYLKLSAPGRPSAVSPVRTAPYPGFPTDAQAVFMAAMLRQQGSTLFEENIFSDRFRHVAALRRMGGNISLAGRLAVVTGVGCLSGAQAEATDLRGGAAMVVAALMAEGESRITGVSHILRGYEDFPRRLKQLGADIDGL